MSAAHPATTGEKQALLWASGFTLEECLPEARRLREEELDVTEQLRELQKRRDPLSQQLENIRYQIEALKQRLLSEL